LALAISLPPAIILLLGLVAQLVEQRIENPCVGGSIPPRATKINKKATFGWLFYFLRSSELLLKAGDIIAMPPAFRRAA
jgi:hypothetical protein